MNWKKIVAGVMAGAMVLTSVAPSTVVNLKAAEAEEGETATTEDVLLADFSFDEEADGEGSGFTGGGAKATGTYTLVDNGDGKAISLSGSQYLAVSKLDEAADAEETTLLAGKNTLTISYDILNPNMWGFYAAPHALSQNQEGRGENYLGALYSGGNLTVERYKGMRADATSSVTRTAVGTDTTAWQHFDVVVTNEATRIFIDGELKATSASGSTFSDLWGEDGVLYIGRANWGNGEYGTFTMDNFKVYDGVKASLKDAIAAEETAALNNATLTMPNRSMVVGETRAANAVLSNTGIVPADKIPAITYTSKNPEIAEVDEKGMIIANAAGIATITASVAGTEKTVDATITVFTSVSTSKIAHYGFDENLDNSADNIVDSETASAVKQGLGAFDGTVVYEDGRNGKAIRLGEYGVELPQKNIGTDYTVSMWVKPDGTLQENQNVLFLGYHNPELWLGISGNKTDTNEYKIWAKGGQYSWNKLWTPTVGSDSWHSLVITSCAETTTAYLDGVALGSAASSNVLVGENQGIYLGVTNWDVPFTGLVDDVDVFSKELTADEVFDLVATQEQRLAKVGIRTAASMKLYPGQKETIMPYVDDSKLDVTAVTWSYESSDPEVATVNENGEVTAVAIGTATITTTATVGSTTKKAETKVTVKADPSSDETLIASYSFDDNLDNAIGEDKAAKAIVTGLGAYSGDVAYEEGRDGKAVRLGDYGIELAEKNVGENYTVSMWVKPDGTIPTNTPVFFLGWHSPENWVALSGNNNANQCKFWLNGGDFKWATAATPTVGSDGWHNLTVVGTAGKTTLYVDGISYGEKDSNDPLKGEDAGIYLGVSNWDAEFNGLMDDVKVYNRALSDAEIYTLYDDVSTPEQILDKTGISVTEAIGMLASEKKTIEVTMHAVVKEEDPAITFESSDTSVAIVDENGVVTAVGGGTATITTTVTLGEVVKTATTTISVSNSINDALVGYYTFEDSLDNQMAENDAATAMVSGLTAYTGEVQYADGKFGKAVKLGDYGLDLNKANIGTDFTVSVWMKPDGTFLENQAVMLLGYNSPELWTGLAGESAGTNKVKVWAKGGSYSWTTFWSPEIGSDGWHNVTLTGTSGEISAYIDGIKLGTKESNNPLSGAAQKILLGVTYWTADNEFTGLMDEVKVYNIAMTDEQVQAQSEDFQSMFQSKLEKAITPESILGDNESKDAVKYDLVLPKQVDGIDVTWESSNPDVISAEGVVASPETDTEVTLTANMVSGSLTATAAYTVKVVSFNKDELNALIEQAESIDTTYCTTLSKENLAEAIAQAKAADDFTSVEKATKALVKAVDELKYIEEYTNPFAFITAPATTKSMQVGEAAQLMTIPESVKNYVDVVYLSSDEATATFKDGKATAVKEGKVTVTTIVTAKADGYVMEYSTALNITKKSVIPTPTPQPVIETVAQVTGINAVPQTTSVKLTWAKAAGAVRYEVYRNNTKIATVTSLNYTDSKLKAGTAYSYQIRAIGNKTTGKISAAQNVLTKPGKVTSAKIKRIGKVTKKTKAKITFKQASGASAYVIYKYNKKTKKYVQAYRVKGKVLYQYNGKKWKKAGKATVKKGKITITIKKLNLKSEKNMKFYIKAEASKSGYTTQYGANSKTLKLK